MQAAHVSTLHRRGERGKGRYHVPPQVIFLLGLEPLQVLQDPSTCIANILLGSLLCLLQLLNGLSRLADLVSSRPLGVDIDNSMNRMTDTTKDLVGDEVST
jgi:hypothetical protein